MSHTQGVGWFPEVRVDKLDADSVQDAIRYLDGYGLRSVLRRGMEPNWDELSLLTSEHGLVFDDVAHAAGNGLVDGGRNRVANLIMGTGAAAFTSAQAIVGVGATSTAFAGTETALLSNGASAYYMSLTGGSGPALGTTGKFTVTAVYAGGVANFAWNEWCFAIGTGTITPGATLASVATSPQMLNRAVASLGTKGSGAQWSLTADITINAL